MNYVLAILIAILVYIVFKPVVKWWEACQQANCDDKVAYDWEYDMSFSQHPFHECRRCRKG